MKPAEIWTTLRLPTRVSPRSPTFSLQHTMATMIKFIIVENGKKTTNKTLINYKSPSYTATVAPVLVPKRPFSKTPIPYQDSKPSSHFDHVHA